MEAADGDVLGRHDGKDLGQVQHGKNIEVLWRQPDDVDAARYRVDDPLPEDKRADARAVYKINVGEIDDDLIVTEADKRFEAHFKEGSRLRIEVPVYIEDHNIVCVALYDLEFRHLVSRL